MILDEAIPCAKVWKSTGIGVKPLDHTLAQHEGGGIQAHQWSPQFNGMDDVAKIRMPEVT